MIKVLGISDPLIQPTGFGRVARELFQRLPSDKFDLGYLSRGWIGSRRYPGVTTYSSDVSDEVNADAFPVAAFDFVGQKDPFLLWTLCDPWQVGWLSHPARNALGTPKSRHFLATQRERFKWIGHFPVDGMGPRDGPPLWFEDFLNGPDHTVFMSKWGMDLTAKLMTKPYSFITHAVNTDVMFPVDKEGAKSILEKVYVNRIMSEAKLAGKELTEEEIDKKRIRLKGTFVIGVVMANRERKYWPQVLKAFRAFKEKMPSARLVGLCGDREGVLPDSWPLLYYAQQLGLRVDYENLDPDVWLFQTVGSSFDDEDSTLRVIYSAMDVCVLLSAGEGFGLPQLEAHACGVPVFVGSYSASTELAVDSKELLSPRGFYFVGNNMVKRPIYEIGDLVDRLVWAFKNPTWRTDTGAKAVEAAKERSWQNVLPRWVELFESIAATF